MREQPVYVKPHSPSLKGGSADPVFIHSIDPFDEYSSEELDHTILRLYRRRDHKLIWTKTVMQTKDWSWSPNGRALLLGASPTPTSSDGGWDTLFVWREGGPLKLAGRSPLDDDYYWDFHWSPDGRRVAFRGGASGDMDVNGGELYCVDAVSGRLMVGPHKELIRRLHWVNATTVRYWEIGYHTRHGKDGTTVWPYTKRKSREWHVRG